MSATQVIASYESLSALTAQMREAALRGDWEPMIGLERERTSLVEAMKPLDAQTRLDDAARRRKDELIGEILGHDAEIRDAVLAWMSRFQAEMQSSVQEMRLLKEYGA
jgi:flagellar protein FliT